jgi:hypothetical protein
VSAVRFKAIVALGMALAGAAPATVERVTRNRNSQEN